MRKTSWLLPPEAARCASSLKGSEPLPLSLPSLALRRCGRSGALPPRSTRLGASPTCRRCTASTVRHASLLPPTHHTSLQPQPTHASAYVPAATKLDSEPRLLGAAFDRVLFSFPHCGVKGQIHRNRDLLAGFFRAVGSSGVLAEGGQVEVTLARGQGGTPLDGERAYGDTWQARAPSAPEPRPSGIYMPVISPPADG